MSTGKVHQPILSPEQLELIEIIPADNKPFDGDAAKFRLGIEALRLGLAYEYDPYFSLSIARVDPLPHQLEAVYDYFLKLPRIRFLLADDPGAGKTIMAGLLIKELKIRGLIKRTLIVTPANLCFQWQRELKDKFREDFTPVDRIHPPGTIRLKPMAGDEPGNYIRLMGLPHTRCLREPYAKPLGSYHRR